MRDKAEVERDTRSLELVEQRLREKAEIYNNFVQGGQLDHKQLEKVRHFCGKVLTRHQAGYLVDFEQKNWDQPDPQLTTHEFNHPDMERERARQEWLQQVREREEEDDKERERRTRQRTILNQIIHETQEGRANVSKVAEER
jgi:hypothetical protein